MTHPVPPSFDSPAAGLRAAMAACLHGAKAPVEHTGIIRAAQKAVAPGTFLLLALLLAGCATSDVPPRLAEVQRLAWVEHAYEVRRGDWRPMWHGDCRSKALMIMQVLEAEGWQVGARVGCRSDFPEHVRDGRCNLAAYQQGRIGNPAHMVPVACKSDECWTIDMDGVWRAGEHPLVDLEGYDWRVAAAAWERQQEMPAASR